MSRFLTIIFFTALSFFVKAQDPHFSQFFASPLTLNPAFTGKFNGNYRVSGNYRNQWPEINNAFVTSTAAVDFHILKEKMRGADMLGIGLMFLTDNSANSAVKFNYGSASVGFHKSLDDDGNQQFSVGLQGTYSNFFIDRSKLFFEDQLESRGFTGQSKEIFGSNSLQTNYFDVNAGILFTNIIPETQATYYAGLSMYHINRPQINLTNFIYQLSPRYTLHAGGFFPFNDIVGLHVSGLYSYQGAATEALIGGAFQINAIKEYDTEVNVYAGSWYRFNDALIPYIGLEYGSTRLGMTYDVTTSSLRTAAVNKGGIEISLIYTHQPNTDKPINCPKF